MSLWQSARSGPCAQVCVHTGNSVAEEQCQVWTRHFACVPHLLILAPNTLNLGDYTASF